jgi:hypothetical protein
MTRLTIANLLAEVPSAQSTQTKPPASAWCHLQTPYLFAPQSRWGCRQIKCADNLQHSLPEQACHPRSHTSEGVLHCSVSACRCSKRSSSAKLAQLASSTMSAAAPADATPEAALSAQRPQADTAQYDAELIAAAARGDAADVRRLLTDGVDAAAQVRRPHFISRFPRISDTPLKRC